jgi:hypothetical protein
MRWVVADGGNEGGKVGLGTTAGWGDEEGSVWSSNG